MEKMKMIGTLRQGADKVYRFADYYVKLYTRLHIGHNAASLSFYAIISIFPLLFFLVNALSYFIPFEVMAGEVVRFLENFLPYQSPLIVENVKTLFAKRDTVSLFGLLSVFLSAGMLYANLQHIIHDMIQATRKRNFFMTRLFFLLWLLGMVLILLSPLIFSAVIGILSSMGFKIPFVARLASYSSLIVVGFLFFLFIIVSLRIPRLPLRKVLAGALYFALTMQAGKILYQWITKFSIDRYNIVYGSFTSLMLIILWIFYFFNMFLFFVYWTTRTKEESQRP